VAEDELREEHGQEKSSREELLAVLEDQVVVINEVRV